MNIQKKLHGKLILMAVILMIGSMAVLGQEFRGTIAGTVSDPNGAVVAGATVLVKNRATNVSQTVSTNSEGAFSVPFLQPGVYDVSVSSTGFKRSLRENLTVAGDDRLSIDFTLEIGADAEVSVSAGGELLEQGTVIVCTSFIQGQIEELPLAEGAP